MKYIIFELPQFAKETVRVFDEITDHSEVACEVLSRSPGLWVKSAGKVRLNVREDGTAGVYCIAGARTLNIEPTLERCTEDTKLLNRFFDFSV